MNVVSLFDGMSCCRLALDKVGIKVDKYYASEIDKYAMQIANKNYPDTIQLGNILEWESWFMDIDWSSIDLVTGGFPCFAEGTLVTTSKGLKPIEEVKKGDMVITHNHTFKPVVVTMMKIANHCNIVKIQGSHELKVTDEHPFYVRKVSKTWSNKLRRTVREFSEPKWVDCKDLEVGDFVGVPINQNSKTPDFSNDLDFWYMIGRYVADGYSSTKNNHSRGKNSNLTNRRVYKTIITCGKHEESVMDSIISKVDYKATKSVETTSLKYTITNKKLWEFVQSFGRGAENKEIPSLLFDAPIETIKAFIDGYLSGDGCLIDSSNYKGNKKMSQITTVSNKLAYGIIQLVQKAYSVQPTITKVNLPEKKIIEGREVNQKPFFTVRFYKEKTKFAKFYVEDGFIWTPFKSRERIKQELPVYNFEVLCDNSYAVNNLIVHNCQAWSIAGKQLGDKDPRGMLFWVMLDVMKEIKTFNPNVKFLIENVKMKKEFEEYITYHTEQALGKVHKHLINSALVSAQNRNRYYWTNIDDVTQPEDKGILLKDILEDLPIDREILPSMRGDFDGKSRLDKGLFSFVGEDKAVCLTVGAKHPNKFIIDKSVKPSIAKNIEEQVDNIKDTKSGFYQLKCDSGFQDNKIGISKTPTLRAGNSATYVRQELQFNETDNVTNVKKGTSGLSWFMEQQTYSVDSKKTRTLKAGEGSGNIPKIANNFSFRKLTPTECERLQTVKIGYTEGVSNSQRYKMLGNGWTVDVIAHIFKGLKC